jgi:hypothetical protein
VARQEDRGCNAYGGTYQVQADSVSFDQITRTEMACEDEAVTKQEQLYFEALESAGRYEVSGNLLRIWYDNEAGVLVFETALPTGSGEPVPTNTPGGNLLKVNDWGLFKFCSRHSFQRSQFGLPPSR